MVKGKKFAADGFRAPLVGITDYSRLKYKEKYIGERKKYGGFCGCILRLTSYDHVNADVLP